MDVIQRIQEQLKSNPVVLFMKGTPDFPQCGFSAPAVRTLEACGANFAHVNIFEDPELREALKRYSNWPTYPQLYVNGELVGGSRHRHRDVPEGRAAAAARRSRRNGLRLRPALRRFSRCRDSASVPFSVRGAGAARRSASCGRPFVARPRTSPEALQIVQKSAAVRSAS